MIGSKLVGKKLSVRVKASAPGYESLKVRTKRSAGSSANICPDAGEA